MAVNRQTTLKGAMVVVAAFVGFGATTVVASAKSYSTPKGTADIHCDPGDVDSQNGSCTITFNDKDDKGQPRAYQQVCFTTSNGQVVGQSGNCSSTDSKGRATALYYASPSACPAPKGDHTQVWITGTETSDGTSASTTVNVKCPQTPKGHSAPQSNAPAASSASASSTSPTATTHHAVNTSAHVSAPAPLGNAAWVGLLALAALTSLGLIARMQFRRLRR